MHRTTRILLIVALAISALALALEVRWSGAGEAASPQQREPELPEFRPSEDLPADAAVAFPADI